MDELQIEYKLPNPEISNNDVQIKKYFKKAKSK
jgi:hypothetical protein